MPITRCPVCDEEFGLDDGLFILPVEPYSMAMHFGDDERKGRDAEHQSRSVCPPLEHVSMGSERFNTIMAMVNCHAIK